MDFKKNLTTSCCIPGAYNGINLQAANPFDTRINPTQPNQWCSNELILKDKDLRCKARIQPLDVLMGEALEMAKKDAMTKGVYGHH